MKTRIGMLSAIVAPALVAPMLIAATPGAHAQVMCERIVPAVNVKKIDVFVSSAAPTRRVQIERSALPTEVCKLATENGRYRIQLGGQDFWVLTSQFAGVVPKPLEPLKPAPDSAPAGVQMGGAPYKGPIQVGVTPEAPFEQKYSVPAVDFRENPLQYGVDRSSPPPDPGLPRVGTTQ